ncbi:MAG TPA: hypothetical protein VFA06_01265 [Actinocrinis sp.]|uniref:hypothetical protein n=1 Tax=Actinocrinis sp. TaxID=1920516 RepID=UPI002D2708BB|nr:hypothetical protein [Actinocrinis sp.]HZU54473.1 hypothetical protein [Actinocrinis sp.]
MIDNGGYHDGSTEAAASGRGPARRIGWSEANRLIDGRQGGSGATDLDTLLAVAAAPASEATLDPAQLEPVLMAFRRAGIGAGPAPQPQPRRAVRQRSPRVALVKCAAVLMVVGGSGVAAATAGVLPASVQQIAHDYLGGVGIPAPAASGTAGPAPSGTPSPSGSPSPSAGSGRQAATTAQLMPLCQTVAANPQDWRSVLDPADQEALVAAAGAPGHVEQYCATLLATASSSADSGDEGATPSPAQSTEPSSKATPGASATHGNSHASHSPSPNPHSTEH